MTGTRHGDYVVRIDYTSTTAHILDGRGAQVAAYGPGVVRHTVAAHIGADGWVLTDGGAWTISPSADGREHPVHQRTPTGCVSQ